MRAKTLLELLTLSTNLYIISKDEEFMKSLSELTRQGKQKIDSFMNEFSEDGEEGEDNLVQKFKQKAQQAKEEFEKKMEEVAIAVYKKMHIAHADDLAELKESLEALEKKINNLATKLTNNEPSKS